MPTPIGYSKPGLEATRHPTTRDIAWAAGFYEGEGSCSVLRRRPHLPRNTVILAVGQKERWPLERLQAFFGGHITYEKPRQRSYDDGRQYGYRWHVHGARARGFILTIYKFLSPRRQGQVYRGLTITLDPS